MAFITDEQREAAIEKAESDLAAARAEQRAAKAQLTADNAKSAALAQQWAAIQAATIKFREDNNALGSLIAVDQARLKAADDGVKLALAAYQAALEPVQVFT